MKKKKYTEITFKGYVEEATYIDEHKTVFLEVVEHETNKKYIVGIDVAYFEKLFKDGLRIGNSGELYTFSGILHKSNGYNCVYCPERFMNKGEH